MKSKKHRYLGNITQHHLVPRCRLADYYGLSFKLPYNKLKLWELRHAAWHVLFGIKTLNEVIAYLEKRGTPYAFKTKTWNLVFKGKSKRQAVKLLKRLRSIKRGVYAHFEFDPSLRKKLKTIYKTKSNIVDVKIYLEKRFREAA
jgi:hypothetical protein